MFTQLRQWFYPKEFRIDYPGVSSKNLSIKEVIKSLEDLVKKVLEGQESRVDTKLIKEIANGVWRLERRMEGMEESKELNRVKRALNMMKDVLQDNNVKIRDYTGKPWGAPYDDMPWDNVQGDGDTIRMTEPRIFYKGKLLQRGKIIVYYKDEGGK